MLGRRSALVALLAAALLAGCGGSDDDEERTRGEVAERVEEQLAYVDPESTAVAAVDMRWEGENWKHLRALASRGLRTYREASDAEERSEIPPNLPGLLNALGGFVGVSFEEDIQPVLDGYLVSAAVLPPVPALPEDLQELLRKPERERTQQEQQRIFRAEQERDEASEEETILVYRSGSGRLRELAEKILDGAELRPLEGHDDVMLIEEGLAVVGDDTLVYAEGGEGNDLLIEALDRAESGDGYPVSRLAEAQKQTELDDPFALAAADRTIARLWFDEPSLERAFEEVPWLGAIRGLSGGVQFDEDGGDVAGLVSTDPRALSDDDLPLAPPGELELPKTDDVAGASRDQSVTTTFLSRTARALFADSDFAKAVERAEDDLGASFEDEVLRQFSCPSMSRFDPVDASFAARSCVKDPERMREVLPKLSEHLPRILAALQRLDSQGLVGLLLIAPDAPLTPAFSQLAAIVVEPFDGDDPEEDLYEITGLHDEWSEVTANGPERVVFGLIGDEFVVASDEKRAREAAEFEGETVKEPAASAVRVPAAAVLDAEGDAADKALSDVLGELVLTAAADRSALTARGRLEFGD